MIIKDKVITVAGEYMSASDYVEEILLQGRLKGRTTCILHKRDDGGTVYYIVDGAIKAIGEFSTATEAWVKYSNLQHLIKSIEDKYENDKELINKLNAKKTFEEAIKDLEFE